ncbi:MAG: hypothetical protein IPO27_03950 [Bacteroidetes bacterium]|nr:hypothetical protein [Bacteroidota bacterium]
MVIFVTSLHLILVVMNIHLWYAQQQQEVLLFPQQLTTCVGKTYNMSTTGSEVGAGVTYQWQVSTTSGGPYSNVVGGTGATTTSYTTDPLVAGVYYYVLQVTCANCGPCSNLSSQLTLTVNANPTVTVSPTSGTFCSPGGTPVTLTAGGANTYAWIPTLGLTPTSGSPVSANPSANTTYTVTGTDGNGCTGTATASIAVNNNAIITNVSANPANVCSGSNSQLTTCALIPTAVNGYTYGTGTGTLDPMTGAATVVSSLTDDAPMNTSNGGNTTAGASLALPFAFNFNGTSYTHYSASPDGWMVFSNSAGAATSQFINDITSTTNTPKIYPYWDDVATGTTGNVTVVTTGTAPNRIFIVQWFVTIPRNTSGPANSTFQAWIHECGGAIQFVYGAMNAAAMSASVGMTGNATNFQSVTISPNSVSIVTANNSNAGQPANGDMYSFTPATPTYSWSPATFLSSTSVASPLAVGVNATTTYTVTVTGAGGCTATSTVTINTSTLVCNAPTAAPACAGSNFTVTASHTGGGAPYTYLWSNSQTNAIMTDNQAAGTYTYTVTVTDACGSICTSGITVTVNAPPTVTASPSSGLICNPGGTAVSITANNAVTYTWAPASGLSATTGATVSANPTASTTYTVTGTDANGCTGTATVVITVATTPVIASISATPSIICSGGSSTLNVTHPAINYCQPTYSSGTAFGDSITLVNILTTTLNNVTGGAPSPFYTLFL